MEKRWPMAFAAAMLFATAAAQVKLNVHTGTITTTNVTGEKLLGAPTYKSRAGFVLGSNMDVRLLKHLWSETGLSYNLRRYGYRASPVPIYFTDVDFRIGYLMLHQLFLINLKAKGGWAFSMGTGLFAGVPFHGRYTVETTFNTNIEYQRGDLDFGNNDTDNFRQFDAGANLLLRLQFKKILFNVLYSHSFTDHVPAGYNQSYKEKFRGFSFMAGYEF